MSQCVLAQLFHSGLGGQLQGWAPIPAVAKQEPGLPPVEFDKLVVEGPEGWRMETVCRYGADARRSGVALSTTGQLLALMTGGFLPGQEGHMSSCLGDGYVLRLVSNGRLTKFVTLRFLRLLLGSLWLRAQDTEHPGDRVSAEHPGAELECESPERCDCPFCENNRQERRQGYRWEQLTPRENYDPRFWHGFAEAYHGEFERQEGRTDDGLTFNDFVKLQPDEVRGWPPSCVRCGTQPDSGWRMWLLECPEAPDSLLSPCPQLALPEFGCRTRVLAMHSNSCTLFGEPLTRVRPTYLDSAHSRTGGRARLGR